MVLPLRSALTWTSSWIALFRRRTFHGESESRQYDPDEGRPTGPLLLSVIGSPARRPKLFTGWRRASYSGQELHLPKRLDVMSSRNYLLPVGAHLHLMRGGQIAKAADQRGSRETGLPSEGFHDALRGQRSPVLVDSLGQCRSDLLQIAVSHRPFRSLAHLLFP
jgi:hypothetical protein